MPEHDHDRLILIVDDDARTCDLLGRLVGLWGCRASDARTLAEGMTRLDDDPDCVILDLLLPDGRGEDLVRAVRARRRPCRVVVCSGETDPAVLAQLKGLGADAVLTKPVEPDVLASACLAAEAVSAAPFGEAAAD